MEDYEREWLVRTIRDAVKHELFISEIKAVTNESRVKRIEIVTGDTRSEVRKLRSDIEVLTWVVGALVVSNIVLIVMEILR